MNQSFDTDASTRRQEPAAYSPPASNPSTTSVPATGPNSLQSGYGNAAVSNYAAGSSSQPATDATALSTDTQATLGNAATARSSNVGLPTTAGGERPVAPAEPVSLAGSGTFNPSSAWQDYLAAREREGAEVPVQLGNLARGTIHVRKSGETYETVGRGHEAIPLTHPALDPLRGAGVEPVLAVKVRAGNVEGYATVGTRRGAAGNPSALVNAIKEHSQELGWLGMDVSRFPATTNELKDGVLRLQVNNFGFKLAGFFNGTGTFGLENEQVTFNATATVHVQGLTDAPLELSRNAEGQLNGRVEVPVSISKFSGNLIANYTDGVVDIRGTVGYQDEKFSGELTLLVTDAATARNVALEHLGPEAVQAGAEGEQAPQERRARPGERAVAGWGTLNFSFTEWLSGTAMVIVDNEGHITVIGEITPQTEVELFPQRDFIHPLFSFEVRAGYGVPLVGQIFLFANIGMEALAKLGPGKIYNIAVRGRYSTDPRVFNEFSIEATLNISAFAGLRLRAEGGAGLTLLGHDIKAGVGLNALAGVRGYVEATPTIGYRESATPEEGRRGEFYIHGHMELAAQPFLGLSGDLFVELDSPWWSPAPDDKWTWPIGELEYPLPGEFGIGADVDYVLGSDQLPEVQFGEVDFNKDKFMTDLLNDHVPPKSQGDQERQGEWQEGETTGAPPEPQLADSQGTPAEEPARGQQTPDQGEPPNPAVQQRWLAGLEALGQLAERSRRDPLNQGEIETALALLKREHGFTVLHAIRAGEDWEVHASMNPDGVVTLEGESGESVGTEGPAPQPTHAGAATSSGPAYRLGGKTAMNLTPRPNKDTSGPKPGLSLTTTQGKGWVFPGGKSALAGAGFELEDDPTDNDPGHFLLRPGSAHISKGWTLDAWAQTRPQMTEADQSTWHELTRILRGAAH